MNVYDRERIFREALERIDTGDYASNWSAGRVAEAALTKADGPPLRCKHCPDDIDDHRGVPEDDPGLISLSSRRPRSRLR